MTKQDVIDQINRDHAYLVSLGYAEKDIELDIDAQAQLCEYVMRHAKTQQTLLYRVVNKRAVDARYAAL